MTADRVPWGVILPALLNFLKALGILPGAVAAFWLRNLYQKRRQRNAIEGWPSAEARIHSGRTSQEGRKHWVELTYSYFVHEYRSGTYIRKIRNSNEGDDLVRLLKNQKVQVHYDPSNPDKSVILDAELNKMALLVNHAG